jgi:hypothetical protein
MRNPIFISVVLLAFLACCGGKEEKVRAKPTTKTHTAPAPAPAPEPEAVPETRVAKRPGLVKVSDDPELNKAVTSMSKGGPGKKSMSVLRRRFKAAIPALLQGMKHRISNVRANSARVLIFLHKEKNKRFTKEVVSALIDRLKNEVDKDVRSLITKTLAKAKDKRFNETFTEVLKNDASAAVRSNAAKGLGLNRAKSSESALIGALSDEDTWVRMEAATALRKLNSRKALPALVRTLSDANSMVRDRVHKALKAITGKSHPANPSAWSAYAQ